MILDSIAKKTKERYEKENLSISIEDMKSKALAMNKGDFTFEKALCGEGVSFICEIKKASPSKGVIAKHFPYLDIAKEYEEAGASCISVLTEPDFFMGKNEYLSEISKEVSIPLLRKDFTIDEYQIYEAKTIGASAVLLICSLLDTETIQKYLGICDELGLSALVETHDEKEIASAIEAGARIIGVNNRDLKTFEVNIQNGISLRKYVPKDILFVAESGITCRRDIITLEEDGVDAVLIGETLMKSKDKKAMLKELRYV